MFNCSFFGQETWLKDAIASLFDPNLLDQIFAKNTAFAEQINATFSYAGNFCVDHNCESFSFLLALAMGQNLLDMFLRLKVSDNMIYRDTFWSSGATYPELSGTSLCATISPFEGGYPIDTGVLNGIEAILDLETFDNGDLTNVGDGAYVQVLDPSDYALPHLKGFSIGPGSSVDVHIRPALYGITQTALKRFDYLQRGCAERFFDNWTDDLNGMIGEYSLSNCLLSATWIQINDE